MKSKVGTGAIIGAIVLLALIVGGLAYATYFRPSTPGSEPLTAEQQAKQDEAMERLKSGAQPDTTLAPNPNGGMPVAPTDTAPPGGTSSNGMPPASAMTHETPPSGK